MHYQWAEKPKIAPSPWDFVTLPEDDPTTAVGNMHKKLVKIACVLPEISCQTDRQMLLITVLRAK